MIKKFIYILIISIAFISCSDFLKEYSQDTAYVRGYEDLDELLLGSVYMPLGGLEHIGQGSSNSYSASSWYYPYIHIMGDEVEEVINTTSDRGNSWDAREEFFGYYTWQQQVGLDKNGTSLKAENRDWDRIYKHINIANMIIGSIDGMDSHNNESDMAKRRIKGEAYFLRGAYYFILANLYGNPYVKATATADLAVPIKNTDYLEDKIFMRNTVQEVYDQVISDLKSAEELLEGTARKSYYRADQLSVRLLLSRVYLYMQDWDNTIFYGEKVLEINGKLENLNTFNKSFFLNSNLPEVIFTMGNGGLRYSISNRTLGFTVSDYVFNLYDDNDLRKTWFIKYNTAEAYPELVKTGQASEINRTSLSNTFLLRSAEAYLNVAEAYAYKGDNANACKNINMLRKNRIDSGNYTDISLSNDELIGFIRDERERELCFEGHRWFDLRRYTVCEKLPWSKSIRHSYTTFEYDWYTSSNIPVQTQWYQLNEYDEAYTLPMPREFLDFNLGNKNNPRSIRPVVETINY